MTRVEMPGVLILGLLVALFTSTCASGQSVRSIDRCQHVTSEYEPVLDAYFQQARGSEGLGVVLRVYGGTRPEYEIVVDPQISRHSIFRYTPERSIWGNVYSLATPHLSLNQDKREALKIPFSKTEVEVPEGELQELVARAKRIDTLICEHLPLKDSEGHEFLPQDGLSFEIITIEGESRASVTDTDGSRIISQNPAVLQWALDL
jgi:hypothetical protein